MKRIIIIDDDPGVQQAFKVIFSPQSYEVSIYHNGSSILKEESIVPDIYILDKQLSGVDGLDICRFLKSKAGTRHVPVIMLSASPNIHRSARLAGADDSLEKPFTIKALRDMVEKYVPGQINNNFL